MTTTDRVDLAVKGGRVYHAGEIRPLTLGVTDGIITHLTNADLEAERSLDVGGKLILPGFVDAHIHLREPGYTEKEGIISGSAAAAAGGITTIVEMPNTTPPVTTTERFEEKRELFNQKSHVDFALYGAITNDNVGTGDISALASAGVTGFKTFMATSFGPLLMADKGKLYRAFEDVSETGLPLYIHAEDEEYLDEFERRARTSDITGLEQFLRARPPIAETTAVSDVIDIVRETGTRTVIVHVTTSEAVNRIAAAQAEDLPIDAEVTPYHLRIDEEALRNIGTVGIGTPPPRTRKNRDQLWDQFDDGTITHTGCDHAPHTLAEKERAPLEVAPGMPQLETALGILLDGINAGRTTIDRLVEAYSKNPARMHGLYPRKGSLLPGSDADFVVIDLDRSWTVDPEEFESAARYSPFEGFEFKGMPVLVYQRGHQIAEDMEALNSPGDGEFQR